MGFFTSLANWFLSAFRPSVRTTTTTTTIAEETEVPDEEEDSTTTTTTTSTTTRAGKTKRSLCMGINDYPRTNNDLRGCVNDAQDWSALLKSKYGFTDSTLLLNSQVTMANTENQMRAIFNRSNDGDSVVITYSGHGSNIPDYDGDEIDGRDETLYLYDGHFTDDKIKNILNSVNKDISITIISDSCHSGTVTRGFLATADPDAEEPKIKFMPDESDELALKLAEVQVKKRAFVQDKDMREVLLTGCTATEFSYDAHFGKPMGAFSYNAMKVLKDNDPLTYIEFYELLRKQLPSRRYPQTPQLEGSQDNKNRIMFS